MKRNKFSLSHYKLLTCKMGQLIPVSWFEALPGDTIQMSTSAFIRCAPLVTPVMHPVVVRFHHFFVPNRIMWTGQMPMGEGTGGFENFITGGPTGNDATAHPSIVTSVNYAQSSLGDYLGLPTANMASSTTVSALPFRAYALIWNEYYRDQDLQTQLTVSTADGVDSTTSQVLQNVCWEKDYLTSSRPWAAKGPGISLFPGGTQVPVKGIGITDGAVSASSTGRDTENVNASRPYVPLSVAGVGVQTITTGATSSSNYAQVFADLGYLPSGVVPVGMDINALRRQFALWRYEEARARYGSRYVEYLRYLGIRSSDARMQRPEYLGGGRQTIQFSEVLQTAPTTAGTGGGAGGTGQFGGHGITAMRSNRYRRFFEEHGIVMTLMSVRPRTMYSNPIRRAWLRGVNNTYAGMTGDRFDYWQKELQFIGQQAINGYEVDASVTPTVIFGYQDRYDEYRRLESSVHGQFRSSPLDVWHLSREFGSAPALNSTFVSCVPSTRVFADTANDNLYVMCNHSIQARRLIAKVGSSRVL